jgi:hypothetical protein
MSVAFPQVLPKPGWPLALLFVAVAVVLVLMRFVPGANLVGDLIDRVWVPGVIVAVFAVVRQVR